MNKAVEKFREVYTYINDETLDLAAKENVQMVLDLLDAEVNHLVKSECLIVLAQTGDYSYKDLILSFKDNESAYVRESVCMALSSYVGEDKERNQEILKFFEEIKSKESSQGVLKRLEICMEEIDFIEKYGY